MRQLVEQSYKSNIRNRFALAMGIGMSMLALAGCTDGGSHSASAERSPAAVAKPFGAHPSEATPASIDAQYDTAYDFIAGFDDTSLSSTVSIPESITDSNVKTITLKAAELKVAADTVLAGETWPVDKSVTDRVSRIQEADVKSKAESGLAKSTFANILLGLTSGSGENIAAEESFLQKDLADNPNEYAAYKTKIDQYTALSSQAQAELSSSDSTKWSVDNNTLNKAWSDANNASNSFWSDLNNAAASAEVTIIDRSPKGKAIDIQAQNSYEKDLHHCDNLASPAKDTCAADEAVSDAQGGYESLFDIWAPMVQDSTQKLRIEAAAADQATSDIQGGYTNLAEVWASKVHNPADRARIDRALVNAAEADYDQSYYALGDQFVADISDPQLKAEATTHKK